MRSDKPDVTHSPAFKSPSAPEILLSSVLNFDKPKTLLIVENKQTFKDQVNFFATVFYL